MRRLTRLLPTQEGLARNRAKIGGFLAGIVAPLVFAGLAVVLYTGHGIGERPEPPAVIYPNF